MLGTDLYLLNRISVAIKFSPGSNVLCSPVYLLSTTQLMLLLQRQIATLPVSYLTLSTLTVVLFPRGKSAHTHFPLIRPKIHPVGNTCCIDDLGKKQFQLGITP